MQPRKKHTNQYRREHILERLNREYKVAVLDLASNLSVSDETVRRDLKDLEAEGLLRRVHGGAISVAPIRDEPIDARSRKCAKEKGVIAQLAVELISDNTSIFLDTGTTTLALARQLGRFSDLKLYTNSLNIAQAAREHFGVSVFVTPGQLRKVELDLVGIDTINYIQEYYFDSVFMGSAGLDIERGFMDYEENEAWIRQTLVKSARNRVMLVDSSKFGKPGNIRSVGFDTVDRLVTDRQPSHEFADRFSRAEMELIHA